MSNNELSGLALSASGQFMNDVIHKRLGIAEEHQRLVELIERIVDAGEARTHAALDDHDRTGFVDI